MALWAMAAAVAGGAPRLAVLLLGSSFVPSGPILAWLGLAGGSMLVMSVLAAHEVAAGRYGQPLIAAGPMLCLSAVLQMVLIPRYGGTGAAIGTAAGATLGALIAMGFNGGQNLRSYGLDLLRAAGGGVAGYAGARLAGAAHVPSPFDIASGCLVSALALLALRLISVRDVTRFASDLTGRRPLSSSPS
jgi:O-antigen/teichoic acid export membrane protein